MKSTLLAVTLALTGQAFAAHIAVIDSGLDYKHKGLQGHVWVNERETDNGRDDDGNGYQDDIYGWNFSGPNNQVIDYKYLGTFSADTTKFFEVQGRMLLGTATDADKEWYKLKKDDKKFLAELGKFGNFVHGTHVTGIATLGTNSQALQCKIIPTQVGPGLTALQNKINALGGLKDNTDLRMTLLKAALGKLAGEQMKMLTEVAVYVHGRGADVANGSFGTGFEQAKTITGAAFKLAFGRDPNEQESNDVTTFFVGKMISEGQKMVKAAPNTLFVFAAGNDGSNNDQFPTSPTNIKADNVISVAATYDNQFLAKFSNYGAKLVDVAAPGMLIRSTIPGDAYLEVSGTSQASPYVAMVAARVKEMNPSLTPGQIKKVILGTVDHKDFLEGKVLTAGFVNNDRAVMAGQLSRSMSIDEAINRSRSSVRDVESSRAHIDQTKKVIPMPLRPMFR